jgi:hypothetical protein
MITTTSIPQAHRSRFVAVMNDWVHANGAAWIRIFKTVRAQSWRFSLPRGSIRQRLGQL